MRQWFDAVYSATSDKLVVPISDRKHASMCMHVCVFDGVCVYVCLSVRAPAHTPPPPPQLEDTRATWTGFFDRCHVALSSILTGIRRVCCSGRAAHRIQVHSALCQRKRGRARIINQCVMMMMMMSRMPVRVLACENVGVRSLMCMLQINVILILMYVYVRVVQ